MNFDLDIKNYDKIELQKLLKLGDSYSNSDVERSCNMLQQRIADNSDIELLLKSRVNNFLTSAKNILVIVDSSTNNPTNSHLLPNTIVQENSHMIIQPTFGGDKINYNLPADLMEGRFNPLYKKSVFKNLTIDSKFRDNYFRTSSSDFRVNLPMTLNKVVKMSVTEVELPLTFYAISRKRGNDFFWIHVTNNGGSNLAEGCYFIRIPEGNYNHEEIIRVINNQLDKTHGIPIDITVVINKYYRFKINLSSAGSGDGRTLLAGVDGAVTQNFPSVALYFNKQALSPTSLTTFVTTEPPFDPTPLPLKLGWNLGFRFGDYTNPAKVHAPSAFVSQGLYEAMGPRYVYLVVDDYNNNVNNSYFAAFNSSILNKNILARISIHGSVFSIMSDSSLILKSLPRQYFGPIDIQKLQIQLLDEYGRILDLNNMDFSFALKLECLYSN